MFLSTFTQRAAEKQLFFYTKGAVLGKNVLSGMVFALSRR
jgi:hypothetical protein